ncbi:hypothetical protein HC723_11675 [Vibrio sp. S11_S32]|uniref:hypothetical protein n=1 Tax=Vibrio sp. S11_S32 TaxID=2720225 RepID=UPI00168141DE|nr:hypothetical protein [Vibrio sp. S11_S32]MBD1577091.1 hypothetical protein [Vibrio sp. S11_S32]
MEFHRITCKVKRKAKVSSQVRKYLKKKDLTEYACLCPIGDDGLQIVSCRTAESLLANAIVYQQRKSPELDQTYVAIAPMYDLVRYNENRIMTALFVKDGAVVDIQTGRLTDDLATYIANQIVTKFDNNVLVFKGMTIDPVRNVLAYFEQEPSFTSVVVTEDVALQHKLLTVEEMLRIHSVTMFEKMVVASVIVALLVGVVITHFGSVERSKVVHRVVDPYISYRNAMKGNHIAEDMHFALKEGAIYQHKYGWSISEVSISSAGRYKATFARDYPEAPLTPFLEWTRTNSERSISIQKKGLFFEDAIPKGNYIAGFSEWILDLDLNLAQLGDLIDMLGIQPIKLVSITDRGNYRVAKIKMTLSSMHLNEITEFYQALTRIPLISKGLTIKSRNDGTYDVVQDMELIGK